MCEIWLTAFRRSRCRLQCRREHFLGPEENVSPIKRRTYHRAVRTI